jgi:hypothetical protein
MLVKDPRENADRVAAAKRAADEAAAKAIPVTYEPAP